MNEIAIIFWTDAAIHGSDSLPREEWAQRTTIESQSVGFIIHEDDDHITLGMDYFPNTDHLRTVQSYPKSGIHQIIRKKIDIQKSGNTGNEEDYARLSL